jgi:CheY-like chemotaxis protein
MDLGNVYELTTAGRQELHGGTTLLPTHAIDTLIRIDGQLTLAQILETVPDGARAQFLKTVLGLRDQGLLGLSSGIPFALDWPAALEAGSSPPCSHPELEAGLASLRRRGFYVEIARMRGRPGLHCGDTPRTAVLVEDDPTLAHFMETLLGLSSFQVRRAGSGKEAVEQLRKRPVPDVILLDVVLPDVDGFAILRAVRAHPVLDQVPVVMLTAEATREAVLKGLHAGADGYLTKPAEPATVLQAIRTVLGLQFAPA